MYVIRSERFQKSDPVKEGFATQIGTLPIAFRERIISPNRVQAKSKSVKKVSRNNR